MYKNNTFKVTVLQSVFIKILRRVKLGFAVLLIVTQLSACAMLQQEAKDYNIYVGSVQVNKLYADSEQIKTDAQPETIQKDTETQTDTTKIIKPEKKSWWRRNLGFVIVGGLIVVGIVAIGTGFCGSKNDGYGCGD